jgi:hypothetical protein
MIKPDKEKYKNVSDNEFKVILKEYDERFESVGYDEASLDVTDYLEKIGANSPEGSIWLGQKIR